MLKITNSIEIPDDEIELTAIRAQGPGGQNVNKVSSAIHLRFDIKSCSLNDNIKDLLLKSSDSRITKDGVIVMKAQSHRTQEKNKKDALERLKMFINEVITPSKKRYPTRVSKNSKIKRTNAKVKRGQTKALRGKVSDND